MPENTTTTTPVKIERKYLAHYIDASFNGTTKNYVRIGKDLEEYNEELNPDVEIQKNILGEQNVIHNGYEVQSDVDPFYAYENDPLFTKLAAIANERQTGTGCLTTKVDVLLSSSGSQVWAYREDVWVIPNAVGGDTSGVQIPYTIYSAGNRVSGTWNTSDNTFTEGTSGGGSGGSGESET